MYRVLIVEDEYYLREELMTTVDWKRYGCVVSGTADNAETAMEAVAADRPDIIITDIQLPGISGLELLRKVDFGAAIIITGHDQFDYARDALRIGVTDFLLKPIDDEELHRALRNAVLHISGRLSGEEASTDDMVHDDGKSRNVACAYRFIERHYREDISLLQTADDLSLSASYLSRIFHEKTGKTFVAALTEYRINIARTLLRDPRLRIEEVASMSGFRDAGYFTRIFKRYTGVSPSRFRCTLS